MKNFFYKLMYWCICSCGLLMRPVIAQTSLLTAVENGEITTVSAALADVENINAVYDNGSDYGTTLVCTASCKGNLDMLILLLDKGGEVFVSEKFQYDALKTAVSCSQTNVVKWLLASGQYDAIEENDLKNLLYITIGNNDVQTFDGLLNRITSLQNKDGYTELLLSAAINGKAKIFEHLLELGGDINAKTDENGETLMHLAANSKEILTLLISKGLSVDVKSVTGKTPLHLSQRANAISFLIDNGADINALDENGWSPLHWAALDGDLEAVEALLGVSADAVLKTTKALNTIHNGLEVPVGSTPSQVAQLALNHHEDDDGLKGKLEKIIVLLP